MTGAVGLNLIAILAVMIPSLIFFYINPSMDPSSSFSILQVVHSIIGFPAFTLALIFAFNDLPTKTKKWMIITASSGLQALPWAQ